ncbi:MAG: hypothetical protein ACJ8GK_13380 [Luteimonas sp.]
MTCARVLAWLVAASLAGMLSTACGRHDDAATADSAASSGPDGALPKPQATGGSITGMPSKPGPNPVGPTLADESDDADVDATQDGEDVQVDTGQAPAEESDDDGAATDDDSAAPVDEPSVQDAVAVLRDYYAAINRQDYQRAWSSWSDGGRSSGQTPQQFADGFANTAQVALQAGVPGPMEGAAGSRYIEIPVTIDATQRDGSVHRYVGTYTLRRAVVDGATDAQRAWHIASAALHPAAP